MLLEQFARMYLKRLAASEVPDIPTDQLLAEISDLLDFFDARSTGSPAIRVFDPRGSDCGYTTPGSVVQVVSDDSPFLVDSVAAAVARSGAHVVRHLHPIVGTVRDGSDRLAEHFGGPKNRGARPSRAVSGSRSIIRDILQQFDDAGITIKLPGKGRKITPKGVSICNRSAHEVMKVLAVENPELTKY